MANPASLTVTELTKNAALNQPAVQNIDTNGTVPITTGAPMDRMMMEVVSSAGQILTVTVKGGGNPPAFGSLDLVTTMSAAGGGTEKKIIGPFETSRFLQADGTVNVQFQAAAGVPLCQVRVYRLPKQI